jgi:arabinose-5-phosphate isomerase
MNNIELGKKIIRTEIAGIEQLYETLGESFNAAIEKILTIKGKVIITGVGKPGHIATKIAATLASTGTPAFFIHATEASHGDLGMIDKNDLVIMISFSGASKELGDIINYCKRFNVFLVGITSIPDSPLGKSSDILLQIPKALEACPIGMAPTTSTTIELVLGDALAITLAERKGFNKDIYKNWHPGGKLGAALTKVSDAMHTLENFPFMKKDNTIEDAVPIMSSESRGIRFGCVAIVDEKDNLIGSFTDGDIRRNFGKAPKTPLSEVMNPNPKYTFEDTLAVEALKTMQDLNIQSLFVTDRNYKPVGIIKLWDLLRLGLA